MALSVFRCVVAHGIIMEAILHVDAGLRTNREWDRGNDVVGCDHADIEAAISILLI